MNEVYQIPEFALDRTVTSKQASLVESGSPSKAEVIEEPNH